MIGTAALDYPSGTHIDPHAHVTHQLIYAERGVMRVRAAGGAWVVPPNRALWVPAGVAHEIRTIGLVHMRTLYLEPHEQSTISSRCAVVSVSPLLRELILRLIQVQAEQGVSETEAPITALILSEIRLLETQPFHVPLPADERLRAICDAIAADPGSERRAHEWAAAFHVSPKTLERDFRNQLGMPFGEWRRQVRLLAALERLAQGEPATSVALSLGYASPSAFTAMFRKALGRTPSDYFCDERG